MCCALSQRFVLSHHLRLSDKATSSDPDIRGLGDLTINSCDHWSPPCTASTGGLCACGDLYVVFIVV